MTSTTLISLVTLKKVCVSNAFQVIICGLWHMTSRKLLTFTLTSIYGIRKYTRNRNSETRWKVVPKIPLFKAPKTENQVDK